MANNIKILSDLETKSWAIRVLAGLRTHAEFLAALRAHTPSGLCAEEDIPLARLHTLLKFWLEGLEQEKFSKSQVNQMLGHWLLAEVGDGAHGLRG